jgi:hypothetical protein
MAEAVAAIADQAFAPAAEQPTYIRNGAAKLQELLSATPDHRDAVVAPADVIAETSVQKIATATQWATVEKLRAIFPQATTTLMSQRLRWRRAPAAIEHREVFATVTLGAGPLRVRREFKV